MANQYGLLARRSNSSRVSSSNYPRYDRNPNTGGNISTETRPRAAAQTIYHSKVYPSHLVLPLIPQ